MDTTENRQAVLCALPDPLLAWFGENARVLPWRSDPTPYHVWVSEIMLQQTRVEAVKPYYARFTASLPDVPALASCPEDLLLKLWEGLGYYSRVRNMQKAARMVMEQYDGCLPASRDELLKLPGIGAYTAGAVASIAFGLKAAAVDGNVLRVMSRLLDDESDITLPAVKKRAEELLLGVMPEDAPGLFNQAMMEIGALICLPRGVPKCGECPLRHICLGRRAGRQEMLPVKKAKAPRKVQERTIVLLFDADGRAALRRRPEEGLLAGLYEFPGYDGHLDEKALRRRLIKEGIDPVSITRLPDASHIFTHIEWKMRGFLVKAGAGSAMPEDLLFAAPREIFSLYSVPSAFAAYKKTLEEINRTEK